MTIGVVGGTGPHGRGLARRFALGGHRVSIGSRDRARADMVAGRLRFALSSGCESVVDGGTNAEVSERADVIVLALPWDPELDTLSTLVEPLAGKIAVSCMNPLGFDTQGAYALENIYGSAAEHAAALLPRTKIVAAFHHLAAPTLLDPRGDLRGEDVLVCGDDTDAKDVVRALCVYLTGRQGIDAGPLRLARYIEPFTAVLISVNRRYRTQSGVVISHVDKHVDAAAG
jgi:8-hydroxy-5-deazaflavin:NADPH oxidoreductase